MTPSEIPQALAALRGHYKVNGKIVFYDGSLPGIVSRSLCFEEIGLTI